MASSEKKVGYEDAISLVDLVMPLKGRIASIQFEGEAEPTTVRITDIGKTHATYKVVPHGTRE